MTAPRPHVTPAEYLASERAAEGRHEYHDGQVYALSGVTRTHDRIVRNLHRELESRLRGRACEYFTSDLRVKVDATGLYTYPDVSALCGEPVFDDPQFLDTLVNPTLIVEVLSDRTEAYDRGAKFAHYRQIPSLREYVLVAQHHVHAERYAPGAERDAPWLRTDVDGADGVLALESLGCTLRLGDLYERVEFPPHPSFPDPRRVREPDAPAVAAP